MTIRKPRFEVILCAQDEIKFTNPVYRQTYGASLMHDRALDTLTYPPSRVGGKTKAALGLEFFDRMHKTKVAFFNQIEQHYATIGVVLGNRND